jgi:hypothetical protein
MVDVVSTLQSDLPQIADWVRQDPFHCDDEAWKNVEGMLTGSGLLSFCLRDSIGPVIFMRFDKEGELMRIAAQFGPEEEVSRRRTAVALIKVGLPLMKLCAKKNGLKGLVFESTSETLIAFMIKQGFKAIGNSDYALAFEG